MALLVSMGALPIACVSPDEPVTTADDGSSAGETGGAPTTSTGTEGSTEFSPTAKYESDTTPPPPAEHAACIAYNDFLAGCFPEEGPSYAAYWAAICDHYVTTGLAAEGQGCFDAVVAWYVCLSNLSCAELLGDQPQCTAESATREAACPESGPEPP